MATLPKISPEPQPLVISDLTALDSFSDVRGGAIDTYNDSTQKHKGRRYLPLFVKKLEGYSVIGSIEGVVGPTRGAAMWVDPDTVAENRFHKIWAVKNKIYLTDEDDTVELRNVEDDGFAITRLIGTMAKNNMYIVIGDATMDSKIYKYIGAGGASGDFSDGGGGKILVTSISHGLVTGMTFSVTDTSNYDGDYEITVVNADSFTFVATFAGDESGKWTVSKQIGLLDIDSMRAASRIFYWEQRLSVTGVGSDQSLAQYSKLDISGNYTSFQVGTTSVDGGDFYGDLKGITCMINHDEFGILFSASNITVHKIGAPIPAGSNYIRDPDTLREELGVSGFGTQSPFGAVSARGAVYYCDPSAGVFELKIGKTIAGFSRTNKDITNTWKSEFLKYDTRDASVEYDSVQDYLLISGVSTVDGGVSDIVLIYSFRTGRWSSDPGKRARQIIASPEEKKLYGFGSVNPEIQHFFDGTYNDDQREKELYAWTRLYDGGRRSAFKDHDHTTQIFGIHPETKNVTFEFINGKGAILEKTTIDLSEIASAAKTSVPGEWGDYQFGLGSFRTENDFIFVQYYNDDTLDEFQRLSLRIVEKSNFPILIYAPEIVAELLEDFAEDIF